MKIREMLNLVESLWQGHSGIPSTLYHGTSRDAYLSIKDANAFYPGGEHNDRIGFSMTEDFDVAERFARMAARRDGDRYGVVIRVDAKAIAAKYPVEPFHDPGVMTSEAEWTVRTDQPIKPADLFILEVDVIDLEKMSVEPWSDAEHGS